MSESDAPPATPHAHPQRVYLAATDGSAASERTLDYAIERADEAQARLIIAMAIYATPIGAPSIGGAEDPDVSDRLNFESKAIVEAGAARARQRRVEADGEVIQGYPGQDIASTVVKFAKENHVHTIFVGSHGSTGIMAVLLGSTAERVVKLAHCHVSVVR
jgi:nucleotide-binding universal stress UspA family protein